MSEQDPSAEYEPKPMSAVKRYYNDVTHTVRNNVAGLMAVSRLVESLPPVMGITVESLIRESEFMPSEDNYELDLRDAKEGLLLLPIESIGPKLEESDMPVNEVREWYEDAIKGIKGAIRVEHGMDCSTIYRGQPHLMCEDSIVCPQRYLEYYIKNNTRLPMFNSKLYQERPRRTHAITIDKIQLGAQYGILTNESAKTLTDHYELLFQEWSRSRTGRQIHIDPI